MKLKTKKLLESILIIVLLFNFAACQNGTPSGNTDTPSGGNTENPSENPENPSEKPEEVLTSHKVTYIDEKMTAPIDDKEYKKGDEIYLLEPEATSYIDMYIFDGWSDGEKLYQAKDKYIMPDADVTFTAVWYDNTQTYSYAYDLTTNNYNNESFFPDYETTGFHRGDKIKLMTPWRKTFETKVFEGWTTNGTDLYTSEYVFGTSDVVFTFVWYDTSLEYTVTYSFGDINAGDVPQDSNKYKKDTYVKILAPEVTSYGDYTFVGWSDGENTYKSGSNYLVGKKDITFTAVWYDNSLEYTVTYDIGYQSSEAAPIDSNTYRKGDKIILPSLENTTIGNFGFAGWNDGSYTYKAGSVYIIGKKNVEFTGIWCDENSEFLIKFNTGSYWPSSENWHLPENNQLKKKKGDKFELPYLSEDKADKYKLDGWLEGNTFYPQSYKYTMTVGDITFRAKWIDKNKVNTPEVELYDLPTGCRVNFSYPVVSNNPGLKFYYTTDGTDPTTSSKYYTRNGFNLEFGGKFTLKVMAHIDGMIDSDITTVYIDHVDTQVQIPTTKITKDGKVYKGKYIPYGAELSLSCSTEGADIYYAIYKSYQGINEGYPVNDLTAENVKKYTEPIILDDTNVGFGDSWYIYINGVKEGLDSSCDELNLEHLKVEVPLFKIGDKEVWNTDVNFGDEISITCPTKNVDIYYTLDGTYPTTESLKYTDPIAITQPCILSAIAHIDGCKDGYNKAYYNITSIAGGSAFNSVKNSTGNVTVKTDSGIFANASHSNPVKVNSFSMCTSEVSYEQWYTVYKWATSEERGDKKYSFANPGTAEYGKDGEEPTNETKNLPVTNISWRDAVVWCNAASEREGLTPVYWKPGETEFKDLNNVIRKSDNDDVTYGASDVDNAERLAGKGYRLPTSAEWEYAIRGGDQESEQWSKVYPNGYDTDTIFERTNDYISGTTVKVGYGLIGGYYGIAGNVAEWCQDADDSKKAHVIRDHETAGRSYMNLKCSYYSYAEKGSKYIGFRLVRTDLTGIYKN